MVTSTYQRLWGDFSLMLGMHLGSRKIRPACWIMSINTRIFVGRKIWNNVPEMSFEVDAFQEFLYVDEALQILIRCVRQMLPFCKEWKDRCVWFTTQKIPTICQSTFVCFSLVPLEQKFIKSSLLEPRCFGSAEKVGVFPWEVHAKRSPVSRCEVCSGRCCDHKRPRETQRATCKDRVGIWKHGTFPGRLECIMRTNLRMILSAVSSIAGWWNISIGRFHKVHIERRDFHCQCLIRVLI